MDFSKIRIAKRVLEVAGIPIPDNEDEIREKAYQYLLKKDCISAHAIRLGKNLQEFTRDDWRNVIQTCGKEKIMNNIGAFKACLMHGLLLEELGVE